MFRGDVAVIIAGGKSSRMQKDKALLPFGSCDSLAEFQYKRLSRLFTKVYLSAKTNKFNFDVEVIEDVYESASPLVALISIFETLASNEVFVLSVDAPFVNERVIEALYASSTLEEDIVVATSKNGVEPLCAIYRRSFLPIAQEALAQGNHRLQSLFKHLKVKEVMIEDEECFMNLNYPKEYEEAKKILSSYPF